MIETILLSVMAVASQAYNPEDGTDLIGLAIIYLPSTLTAAIGGAILWKQRKAATNDDVAQVKKNVEDANNQVINDHEDAPPLRKDLDTKFAILGTKVDAVHALATDHGTRLNNIEDHLRGR